MASYQVREGDKMKQKKMTVTSTANRNTHHPTWMQMMKMRAMMSSRRYGRLFRLSQYQIKHHFADSMKKTRAGVGDGVLARVVCRHQHNTFVRDAGTGAGAEAGEDTG